MASLYGRATPQQARLLRIVEGAVKNALHAHPGQNVLPSFARSVAKRAAGTITSQWRDVLTPRKAASDGGPGDLLAQAVGAGGETRATLPARSAVNRRLRRSVGTHGAAVAQLKELHRDLGILTMVAKWGGLDERVEALQDALKLVDLAIKRCNSSA